MTKQKKLTEIKWIDTNAINIKCQYQVSPPAIYTLLKGSNSLQFKWVHVQTVEITY